MDLESRELRHDQLPLRFPARPFRAGRRRRYELPPTPTASAFAVRSASSAERLELVFDQRSDELWARGADYRVGFGAHGATFVPFFGSSAARNFEVAFGPPPILVGGARLELAHAALPVRDADVVRIDHGVVDEVYRLSLDSIEQQFVVEVPVEGEIVVSIPVATDLEPCECELRFTNEIGHVTYGSATAIDAAGRRLELACTWIDGHIEIRVPEEFARRASYPLTVPALSTLSISNTREVIACESEASARSPPKS